ncbi:lipopolysaccharide biosynthesis protein [Mesorhizobium sp. 8]|uniref:lipopolysaccharide biosynthesis protein n=1 Tax=Mesorhizobium sp. 8 TaxID=2584466 RepID=UPI00112168F3|nr:lipopolysaccharide biosynthesis protein [Mesorhizobium sp. 8]QDC02937.1 lipopolysaccharide biosynthesis protein [Mesorhizobium sp. 8]
MNLMKAFGIDVLFYGSSKALVAVTWIVIISTLTKHLSPANYATFWQIFTLIVGAATIVTTGLVTAFRRYYGQFEQNKTTDLYSFAATGVTRTVISLGLLCFVPAFLISAYIGEWPRSGSLFALAIFSFGSAALFQIYSGHLMAKRKTTYFLAMTTAQAVLFLAFCSLGIFSGDAKDVLLAVLFLGLSYVAVVQPWSLTAIRRTFRPFRNTETRKWEREFLFFGLPLAFMNGAFLLGNMGIQLIIANMASPYDAGIYAAFSAPIERLVGFMASIAAMAFLPLVAVKWDQNQRSEVLRFLGLVVAAVALISTVISILLVIFNDQWVTLIIDKRYKSGIDLIPVLCAATTVSTIASILADVLIVEKKTVHLAVFFTISSIVGLVFSAVLIPIAGVSGAVLGRLISAVFACMLICFSIWRSLR